MSLPMKNRSAVFYSLCIFLFLILQSQSNRVLSQNSPVLIGVITNASTGNPIVGARITVNSLLTYSVTGGSYFLEVNPPGTYTVTCSKTGYDNYISTPLIFQAGQTVTLSIQMLETPNPPESVSAVLDTVYPQKVTVSWQPPVGNYELIYDDGIPEDFSVWSAGGNMNAVKFTPVSYPVKVTGGSVNIGTQANYPQGSNPFVPFQVAIYDATGANGAPGSAIAGPFDVIPVAFGWISFTVPVPPVISSGNFYVVMIQGGNAPNAAGIAIDKTNSTLRSFQRFMSGGSPWLPADGNFLIRAIVKGSGGPIDLDVSPLGIINHEVWRLRQGEEMNPYVWIPVGVQTSYTQIDNSWPSLPCGPFLWAVKTQYSGNRWSPAVFSNIIGKCWTYPVTVHVDLTCSNASIAGTDIKLQNMVYPDTIYSAILDTTGIILFPKVWKGTYELQVSRFNYLTKTIDASIIHDTTLYVLLQQQTSPPSNLTVDGKSLKAAWNKPQVSNELFNESWAGGNFTTNGWSIEGGFNWFVSQTIGMPSPSAMFGWMPQIYNYNQSLISKNITGHNSTILELRYDIMLDNFATTTLNEMAVELWTGTEWLQLKLYDNSKGNIPWTQEIIDISSYSNLVFRVRFRAFGGDSYDINSWNVDNIRIIEAESPAILDSCILGYYFTLDNAIAGFVTDTTFYIPPNLVQYGNTYNACVQAVFASGISDNACSGFTSHYLIPPSGLTGSGIEDAIYLTWNQPFVAKGNMPRNTPAGLIGYYIYRNGILIDSIANPDTLFYYDFSMEPGNYTYGVSAKYDLASYGYPGETDQSVLDGPVTVVLDYGRLLPFTEPWDQGSFAYNDWSFSTGQGNWQINTAEGNPFPCAEFYFEPVQNNYAYHLESPVLTALNVQCAEVWLDMDYMLLNSNPTGKEKLAVSVYFNNRWHMIDTIVNSGESPWTSKHYDISIVRGKGFRIRLTAKGDNSADIISWRVDNIRVYSICNPALNLAGDPLGYDVHLTWNQPDCSGNGLPLEEGFEGELFPPANWTRIVTNANATWSHSDANAYYGVHSGTYSAGLIWDYYHQDEWLIAHDIEVTGNLKFWSFAYQGSTHQDHYYVKISVDNGASWDVLLDMSALPSYPSASGYNQWNDPYIIDMTSYMGEVGDIAWQAVDGDSLGLWYAWAIDDCSMGMKSILQKSFERTITGYDIFRQDNGSGSYNKINTSPVPDTSYVDPSLAAGEYSYFANAVSSGCNYATSSDTITVDVITGIQNLKSGQVVLFPNPASGNLNILSDLPVRRVEIIDLLGTVVCRKEICHDLKLTLEISKLSTGIYLLHLLTDQGTRILKFTVQR
jgi:hypothetical protein